MEETVKELRKIVHEYSGKLAELTEEDFSAKPRPDKWSRKEVVGHLIDSAHNNLRRFIVGQYDSTEVICYEQDFWVQANGYQSMRKDEIIQLWKLMNERICAVLLNTPPSDHEKSLVTSRNSSEPHSLRWLASDYVRHIKHHLNQVFINAFAVSYP
jgi:hypothetical protein